MKRVSDMITLTGLGTEQNKLCLLYTSDAADERSSVDLGGRRIIKKKNRDKVHEGVSHIIQEQQHIHSLHKERKIRPEVK